MNNAVFIDKDGTLVKNIPYNVDYSQVYLKPFALKSLKLLKKIGYKLILISNQSGVNRGFFSESELLLLFNQFIKSLKKSGVCLDGIYYCPHYFKECSCRKPKPGLLLKASQDHIINLKKSWMVGDILDDIEAGKRSGCKTILIGSGSENGWKQNELRKPDIICRSLLEAVKTIWKKAI